MARLVYGGVFEKHPDIRFVTHHMGGMIPYFASRIDAFSRSTAIEYARLGIGGSSGAALTGPPSTTSAASTTTRSATAPPRRSAIALHFFGADRILFGTDFPFGPEDGSWAVEELRAIREMDLPDEYRERILHGNLERLLGL